MDDDAYFHDPDNYICFFFMYTYLFFVRILAKIHGISFDLQIKTIDIKNDVQ